VCGEFKNDGAICGRHLMLKPARAVPGFDARFVKIKLAMERAGPQCA
jgi:hypothetical protein